MLSNIMEIKNLRLGQRRDYSKARFSKRKRNLTGIVNFAEDTSQKAMN